MTLPAIYFLSFHSKPQTVISWSEHNVNMLPIQTGRHIIVPHVKGPWDAESKTFVTFQKSLTFLECATGLVRTSAVVRPVELNDNLNSLFSISFLEYGNFLDVFGPTGSVEGSQSV